MNASRFPLFSPSPSSAAVEAMPALPPGSEHRAEMRRRQHHISEFWIERVVSSWARGTPALPPIPVRVPAGR